MRHDLKIWPIYFTAIESFRKTFECRVNDRDFQENDTVYLYEYLPQKQVYTGRLLKARIGFVLTKTMSGTNIAMFSLLDIVRMPFPSIPSIESQYNLSTDKHVFRNKIKKSGVS